MDHRVTSAQDMQPSFALLEVVQGAWLAYAVHVAIKLGIADLLRDGPKSVCELAQATGTHEASLYRLLRALASRGIFTEKKDEQGPSFAQSTLSAALRSDLPDSIYHIVRMLGEPWQRQVWDGLEHSVRTGGVAFEYVHGMPLWHYCHEHPDAMQSFNLGMTSFSGMVNQPIANAYDFSTLGTLVDLGGGHGSLLSTILRSYPSLKGILFDLPPVIEGARTALDPVVKDRCTLVSGSFFEAVLPGAGGYLMKQILHDWKDEECRAILRNCRNALQPGGRVLVADRVIQPEDNRTSSFNKMWDLLMLTVPGGQERTPEEFAHLYEASGFQLTRIVQTGTPISIIEGIPM